VIDRKWLPWERRTSFKGLRDSREDGRFSSFDFPDLDFPDLGDDPISAILGVVLLVVFGALFLVFLIFTLPVLLGLVVVLGELLALVCVAMLLAPLRLFLPWKVVVYRNGLPVRTERIRGFLRSSAFMEEARLAIELES